MGLLPRAGSPQGQADLQVAVWPAGGAAWWVWWPLWEDMPGALGPQEAG